MFGMQADKVTPGLNGRSTRTASRKPDVSPRGTRWSGRADLIHGAGVDAKRFTVRAAGSQVNTVPRGIVRAVLVSGASDWRRCDDGYDLTGGILGTMNETLFAHLATRFGPHPENLATEALGYIFRRSALARDAVRDLLRGVGVVVPSSLI
ncbi:hypothetical protein [Sorangium sp. So ce1182]|uniref:hypothetical protein n=1 Tax=Sorangium sp. So ce1182 TaxID=3133334 RepID=UPI003F62BA78